MPSYTCSVLTLLDAFPAEPEFALGSLRRALAGLPEPSRASPGRPRVPEHLASPPEERAAPRARTAAAGLSKKRHGVSAVEQTVPVCRLRMRFRPQRRFDRSMGPSKSQRAVRKSVRLARPSHYPEKKASHRNRKANEFRNGTGIDAVCSVPCTASATCAVLTA